MPSFDHETVSAAGANDAPWRAATRSAAYETYLVTAMPNESEEIWRYVELGFDLDDYAPALEPGPSLDDDPLLDAAHAAVAVKLVDGYWVGDDVETAGVTVASLDRSSSRQPELIESVVTGTGLAGLEDRFALAATAFGGDGAFIHIPKGTVAPGVIYVETQATKPGSASFPRIVIAVDEGAEVSIVIHFRSRREDDLIVVPQIAAALGDNANLSVTVVQNWGYGTRAIGNANAVVGRDAGLRFAEIGLGGKLARLHLDVRMEGRGSSANVVGAYFGDKEQILDYRYFMRHIGTNTRSDMFLKGAVEDEARSVFTGMIRIEESGQKTEAFQTNRNLILSDGASAQSVPNLEILANDVRCGHGSTVGPLDAGQRYYLMSRGIGEQRADRLQVHGFFEEALLKLPQPEIVGPVRDWINDKFVTAQVAGRV
ncbi:MAG: Fe-S cluster assembly protein SufD [Acidimicrobiia bacterium]|nr:MAG: Fe-S cluster assembly protein SufD [Acidimicrobiia bacterium]